MDKFKFARCREFSMASDEAMERMEQLNDLDFEELIELLKFFLYHSDHEWEEEEDSYDIKEMAERVFNRILETHGSDPLAHSIKEDDGEALISRRGRHYHSSEKFRGFTHVYEDSPEVCDDLWKAASGQYTEDEISTIWYVFYHYSD